MTNARYVCLLLAVGCATPASTLRDDNRRLNETVTELRTDRRTQDRKLRDLQHQLDELRADAMAGGGAAIPVLPVEIAGPPASTPSSPDAARVVGVADDGTEIVYEGDAAAGRAAVIDERSESGGRGAGGAGSRRLSIDAETPSQRPRREPRGQRAAALPLAEVPAVTERLEVTRHVPPLSARAAVRAKTRDRDGSGDRGGDAAGDYRAAVELVKAGKHDEAVAALRAFITRYPRHDYADNAQYWLGETHYAQKAYTRALSEFRKVIEVYPRGNKVPDALLKVGYCHLALGQGEKGRAVLEQVVTLYPTSEPGALAAKRLETP